MKENKRQLQKESTRKLIIETAYQVYSNHGFRATTNMIAKEAHISHGNIFVHFPTVEDLLNSLLEQFTSDMNVQLHELSHNNDTLDAILYAHIDALIKHQSFYKRLITESSFLPEQAKYTYISIQATISFHISQVIERYQEEKKITKLPVHFICNTWFGLLHYYLSNEDLFAPEGDVLSRYKVELVNNFMHLLCGKE